MAEAGVDIATGKRTIDDDTTRREAFLVNQLVDRNIVVPSELKNATVAGIDTLVARISRILAAPNDQSRAIAQSYLGIKDSEYHPSRVELVAKAVVLAMLLKVKYGEEVAGVVLIGSRVRKGFAPRPDSDLDLLVVTGDKSIPLDFKDGVTKYVNDKGAKLFGFPVNVSDCFRGIFLLDAPPEVVQTRYPQICEGCVPIIFDQHIRTRFDRVFGEKMKLPQQYPQKTASDLAF